MHLVSANLQQHCKDKLVTTGLEQPLYKWSGWRSTCQNCGIPQKCALSEIESEGIFMFQASLHVLL